MSNGLAFVLDHFGDLPSRVNHDLVEVQPLVNAEDVELLKIMIERHYERTGSRRTQELLGAWDEALPKFRKVAPPDMPGQADPMSEVRHHLRSLREELGIADGSVPAQAFHKAPAIPGLTTNPWSKPMN